MSNVRRDYVLQSGSRYTQPVLEIDATITAGSNVEACNRVICEITAAGRPTAGLAQIVLIG